MSFSDSDKFEFRDGEPFHFRDIPKEKGSSGLYEGVTWADVTWSGIPLEQTFEYENQQEQQANLVRLLRLVQMGPDIIINARSGNTRITSSEKGVCNIRCEKGAGKIPAFRTRITPKTGIKKHQSKPMTGVQYDVSSKNRGKFDTMTTPNDFSENWTDVTPTSAYYPPTPMNSPKRRLSDDFLTEEEEEKAYYAYLYKMKDDVYDRHALERDNRACDMWYEYDY